ncbi:hypothetical protein L1987_34928 [Smallanthus sonchifolius]|uniref:Uncharacterized protein n=1 Tax=Smallanthus sonchifolius TaxID=185202 RepID=A0ACB9HUL3_9ASTR|nr:hypothetical protein L1987_34928 [Smallanthus sonchifolius]
MKPQVGIFCPYKLCLSGVCYNARESSARIHTQKSEKLAMSRQLSNGGSRKTIEAAPPRLLRLERRPTMEKKLPTIKEDECSSGDQLQNFHGNRATIKEDECFITLLVTSRVVNYQ